jgi:hypothetical protein
MVLTASFVISPVIGFVATVIPEKRQLLKNLTSASRRQDHTTSPSASVAPVLRRQRVHCIPHPTFVTIAIRPSSSEAGRLESIKLRLANGQAKYFLREG